MDYCNKCHFKNLELWESPCNKCFDNKEKPEYRGTIREFKPIKEIKEKVLKIYYERKKKKQ